MSKKDVAVGSIVSIPFDSVFAVAKILFVSDYFKQIALFKIYKYKLRETAEYVNVLGGDEFQLIYTGTTPVKKGS